MLPVLFKLGSVSVYSFGVVMAVAFFVAGSVMERDFARKRERPDLAWSIVVFGLLGGLLGARVHQGLLHWARFSADPLAFIAGQTGLVWYGGLIGGTIATIWPIRRARVPYASALDTAALGLSIGLAIGRIGCHLSGDGDWGTVTQLPWGVAYVHGTAAWPHPPGIRVHPAPLYESLAMLVIFAALMGLRTRLSPPGALFAIYLVLAAAVRFLIELVRTNSPVLFTLSEAQLTSVALGAGAAAWLWVNGVWLRPRQHAFH